MNFRAFCSLWWWQRRGRRRRSTTYTMHIVNKFFICNFNSFFALIHLVCLQLTAPNQMLVPVFRFVFSVVFFISRWIFSYFCRSQKKCWKIVAVVRFPFGSMTLIVSFGDAMSSQCVAKVIILRNKFRFKCNWSVFNLLTEVVSYVCTQSLALCARVWLNRDSTHANKYKRQWSTKKATAHSLPSLNGTSNVYTMYDSILTEECSHVRKYLINLDEVMNDEHVITTEPIRCNGIIDTNGTYTSPMMIIALIQTL